MKKYFVIYLLALVTMLLACKGKQPEPGYKNISLANLKEDVIGKDVQFVDVRTAIEYKSGHIDDAVNMNILNKKKFKEQTEVLDKTKPVYVYCMSGKRSYHASKLFQSLGFKTIYDYSGGWSEWSKKLDEKSEK